MRPLPNAASFLTTEDCNLRCSYCFEKHNRAVMTKEVAERGIDFLIENAIKGKEKGINIMVFGGEPLLQPKLVDHLLTYGRAQTLRFGLDFWANIVTNTTLFNKKIEDLIAKHLDYISVQMSVDGIKESHDMYRLDANGNGSFDRIVKNIPKFKKAFTQKPDSLSIHGVLNRQTLSMLSESYFFFRHKLGLKHIWFMPIHTDDWTEEDVATYDRELGAIVDYIIKTDVAAGNATEALSYAPIDSCSKPDRRSGAPCGAGKNFVTITANGDLYPCHQFYFNDPEHETKIGDIFNGIFEPSRELFVVYSENDLSCHSIDKECDAYHCYKCIGDNFTKNGSILSQIMGNRCGLSKVERKYQKMIKEKYAELKLFSGGKGHGGHGCEDCSDDFDHNMCDVVVHCNGVTREELLADPDKYREVSFEERMETVIRGMLDHIISLTDQVENLTKRLDEYDKKGR